MTKARMPTNLESNPKLVEIDLYLSASIAESD